MAIMGMDEVVQFFSTNGFMPHIHCYLAKPSLVWTMFTNDLLIGTSYVVISISLYRLIQKIKLPFSPMFLAFGLFIFACGLTHFMEIYNLWVPSYWLAAFVKSITSIASVVTAIYLIRITPQIVFFANDVKESEKRRILLIEQTSELQKTYKELENTQSRFKLMIEGVRDYAIFSMDTEGTIISWNEGAVRIHQYKSEDIVGKHFRMLFMDKDIAEKMPEKELEEALLHEKFEIESWRVRKDDTKFYANDVITAIKNEEGVLTGFTVVTKDMTENRLAQEQLKFANNQLELRVEERTRELKNRTTELENTLHSRDEFLSVASHELKTPLTSVFMQLQLLKLKLDTSFKENKMLMEPDLQKLDQCIDQSKKLSNLIDELLDLTRIRAGRLNLILEEVNLVDLINYVVKGFNYEKNINVHCSGADIKGNWDRMRIEQVVTNLISNAIKYGGNKLINITIAYDQSTEQAIFSVKDEGIGMSEDLQSKIFQRFSRATYDNKISGLGLGLYISKQIIEAHSGHIELLSEEKKGTMVTVVLPTFPILQMNAE